jgi:hypothetical protein
MIIIDHDMDSLFELVERLTDLRACADYLVRRDSQWAIVRIERCDNVYFLSDKSGRSIGFQEISTGRRSVTSSRLRRKGLSKGRASKLRRAGCRGLESG